MGNGKRDNILAILCLFLALAFSAEASFDLQEMSLDGKVQNIIATDLTGDGLKDLVVIYRAGLLPDWQRRVAVYHQGAKGYSTKPNFDIQVADSFALIDTAPAANGKPGEEVYLLANDGLYLWSYSPKEGFAKPQRIFQHADLLVFPDRSSLNLMDFIRTWKGDDRQWVLLLSYQQLILTPLDDLKTQEKIKVPMNAHNLGSGLSEQGIYTFAMQTSIEIPAIAVEDANADGLADLYVSQGERIWLYKQGEDGRFSEKPDQEYFLPIMEEEERKLTNADVITAIYDLDGDKRADVVASKFGGSFPNLKSLMHIHMGKEQGGFVKEPDFKLATEGFSRFFRYPDINGDGRRDLVIPHAKIGITDIIQILLTKKVKVIYDIYLSQGTDGYPDKPDFKRKVVFYFNWRAGITMEAISPRFDCDFNADGKADMIVGKGIESVQVYLGGETPADLFSDQPAAEKDCPASVFIQIDDLNGDGYDDFFIAYPYNPDREGQVRVFLNDGKWPTLEELKKITLPE